MPGTQLTQSASGRASMQTHDAEIEQVLFLWLRRKHENASKNPRFASAVFLVLGHTIFFYVSRRVSQPKAMRECGKKEKKKTKKKMLHTVHVDQFCALN